ncbi:unnamed protein product [Sphenostylis stenocarpa]|uniref:Uncharacterized protein n=1 Tax=Sphenostylis stenocarpa TaxID=92480 RepID=A0AA86RPD2_9FABA|nr:unnamed protein product [Sphenostylis stenocarpa]
MEGRACRFSNCRSARDVLRIGQIVQTLHSHVAACVAEPLCEKVNPSNKIKAFKVGIILDDEKSV